jgi:hypothetical protein
MVILLNNMVFTPQLLDGLRRAREATGASHTNGLFANIHAISIGES